MPLIPSTLNPKTTGSGNSPAESWSNLIMGKKLGDKNDANSFDKKELPSNHRVIDANGGMATQDFVKDRLNLHVGDDGTVHKITHG